jgi:hypothetical protein
MIRLGICPTGGDHQCIGLGLQIPATTLHNLCRTFSHPCKEASTFSHTLAAVAVPTQVLAVTYSQTQPQIASSDWKSGL